MPASSGGGRKVIMFFFNTINVVVNKTNVRLSLEEKDRTTSLFLLWKISSNRCYILWELRNTTTGELRKGNPLRIRIF